MILIIESSSAICSVALSDSDGNCVAELQGSKANSHAEELPGLIQNLCQQNGLEMSRLSAVAIGRGPGSYTGLRIGTSLAKGIAYALQIPLISTDPFEGMASTIDSENTDLIFCAMDARRDEVYAAIFNEKTELLKAVHSLILTADSMDEMADKIVHVCGNSNEKIIRICGKKSSFMYTDLLPHASQMCAQAGKKYGANIFENTAYFEPLYLKEFMAGTTQKFKV